MHKIKLILLLILPISVFAQDLGIIDTRTTKNPALNGTYRISTDGKNLFFRNFIGISEKVANTDSATFTGLITLPSTTSIGNVSSTELSYLDGVTSSIQTQLGNKQPQLNGTGFVKASGTTISYDNSTYLTTSDASSTYLPLAGGTITGSLTLNNGAKFVGQVGTLYNGNQVYVDFLGTSYGRIQSYNAVGSFGMPLVLQGSGSNVGIGIVPTSRKLEVSDVIRSIGGGFEAITPLSSGSSYQWLLNTTDDKFYLNSSTDKFVSNFSTRLLVDNSGNVGIGTTTPSYKLDVNGSFKTTSTTDLAVGGTGLTSIGAVAGTNTVGVEIGTNRTGTGTSYIDLGGEATNTDYGLRVSRSGFTSEIQHSGTGNFNINSIGTGNLLFSTQNAERMRINLSGNVGIGTITDAGYKLDVNGTARFVNGVNLATTSGSVGIGTTSPSSILHTIGTIQTSSTSSASSNYANRFNNIVFSRFDIPTSFTNVISNSWSGTTTDQTMNFEIANGSSTRVTAMTLVGNGNVGIGTTSPQNLLHVKGTPSVGVGVRNSHFMIESTQAAGVDVGAVLKFAGQSGNTVNPYSFGTIEAKKESAVANNYSSYLAFYTIESNGGGTERMRISGNGSISIGTTTADASAKLDITSTTQGVLFPRMTTAQINAIVSPANGLTVYNTDLSTLCFYHVNTWKRVVHVAM
jgi:hypothetical protein